MKLEQSFEVDAPLDAVWAALIDVERVAPCLPGAEITEVQEDGTYTGTFSVKLGPTTASYRGTLKIEEADEATHRATMRAQGTDKRGQGGAKALMVSAVRPSDSGGTQVDVETDFTITGRLASFSRGGMIKDISNRLLREFAECLQESLKSEPVPASEAETLALPTARPRVEDEDVGAPTQELPLPPTPAPATPSQPRSAPKPAKPISGFSVFFGALWDRLRRLLGRSG